MVLNEFDAYREALKKVNLNEEVMPIYNGRLLTENVEYYCKIQKLLNCPSMEQCHKWLYDLDVENLDENECSKINNLFQLGLDKGYIEDDPEDDEELSTQQDVHDMQHADVSPDLPVKDPAPVIPAPKSTQDSMPMAAYTVVYSAMRDGQIKTGEAYSNSINTRSAKADVISKLERAGYQNITILAIEAGDPDMSGCDSTYCKKSDYEIPAYEDDESDEVDEADLREPLAHSLHPFGVNASTANSIGQDEVKLTITEDEVKAEVKKAFDAANKQVQEKPGAKDIQKFLIDNKSRIEKLKTMISDKAQKNLDAIVKYMEDYASGKLDEAKKPTSGVATVIRGLLKILLTLISLSGSAVGFTGKIVAWAGKLLTAGADRINATLGDSEQEDTDEADDEVTEASDDDSSEDDSDDSSSEDDSDDNADDDDDSDDSKEDEDDEDASDDAQDEESAEEPDEKLKNDKKEETGEEDAKDDKEEKELTAQEKTQLRDSYKKSFKAAMQKCKFTDKCFDDLTLDEKVKFFTELDKAWADKADPSKFMSDKETEALQKIVIKK